MLRLLSDGHAAGAPALFWKVDEHTATIADIRERDQFVFVAQAIIMQRLRGDDGDDGGDGRDLVRAELEAEGVANYRLSSPTSGRGCESCHLVDIHG
jgi:hypothetical protein